jgi:LPXTG-site transpeptidase (sortase) family protein
MSSRLTPRRLLAVTLVVVGLVVASWALFGDLAPRDAYAGAPAPASPDAAASAPTPAPEQAHRATRPSRNAGVPTRLVVPALHIDAPVVRIGVTDGTLIPPDDPQVLGWWQDGAVPGARTGSALITGHTVHTGGGAMDHLETLRDGDRVTVRTHRGDVDYRVRGVTVYRKATLAKDAARIFSQERPGRLVLITCEDWDGTRYLSNAVVVAQPA